MTLGLHTSSQPRCLAGEDREKQAEMGVSGRVPHGSLFNLGDQV